jgi:hypothetical protein
MNDPLSLNLKMQAGRQAVPHLLVLPTYNKFGRNQPRNNRRRKLEIFQILGLCLD